MIFNIVSCIYEQFCSREKAALGLNITTRLYYMIILLNKCINFNYITINISSIDLNVLYLSRRLVSHLYSLI